MNITVGITSYNRPEFLSIMSRSLHMCEKIEHCNIRIYDDCSKDFDKDFLKELFPDAVEVKIRGRTLGSDENIHQMYVDFLETGDDVFVGADSDLLFRPDWVAFVEKYLPQTDGVLGLYNSVLHPADRETKINNTIFIHKSNIGSAGLVFRREIMQSIVKNVSPSRTFDWDFSKHLEKMEVRILVSKIGYVQHIGIHGYNTNDLGPLDYGLNFYPGNAVNEREQVHFFQEALQTLKAKDKYIETQAKHIENLTGQINELRQAVKKLSSGVLARVLQYLQSKIVAKFIRNRS